jgi:hypothetical protein
MQRGQQVVRLSDAVARAAARSALSRDCGQGACAATVARLSALVVSATALGDDMPDRVRPAVDRLCQRLDTLIAELRVLLSSASKVARDMAVACLQARLKGDRDPRRLRVASFRARRMAQTLKEFTETSAHLLLCELRCFVDGGGGALCRTLQCVPILFESELREVLRRQGADSVQALEAVDNVARLLHLEILRLVKLAGLVVSRLKAMDEHLSLLDVTLAASVHVVCMTDELEDRPGRRWLPWVISYADRCQLRHSVESRGQLHGEPSTRTAAAHRAMR